MKGHISTSQSPTFISAVIRVVTWGLQLHSTYVKLGRRPPPNIAAFPWTAGLGKHTFPSAFKEGNSRMRSGDDGSNLTSSRACLLWAYFQGEPWVAFTYQKRFPGDSSPGMHQSALFGTPPMCPPLLLDLHFSAGLGTQTLP